MKLARYSTLTVLILLVGCSGDDGAAPAKATASPSLASASPSAAATASPAAATATPAHADAASRAVLDAYLAAWNAHDAAGAGMQLAEDVQYFDASFAGLQLGRQAAVEQGISVFLRGVPDLRWEIRSEPIVSANGIAYEWTFTGTHTGTWGGLRATNQKINLKGVSFLRIRDGKISYHASYYDGTTLNRQLGL